MLLARLLSFALLYCISTLLMQDDPLISAPENTLPEPNMFLPASPRPSLFYPPPPNTIAASVQPKGCRRLYRGVPRPSLFYPPPPNTIAASVQPKGCRRLYRGVPRPSLFYPPPSNTIAASVQPKGCRRRCCRPSPTAAQYRKIRVRPYGKYAR